MGADLVALLRGINVGTANRIKMADLRAAFESLGHREVRTVLQSGNVVFAPARAKRAATPDAISTAVRETCGVESPVSVFPAGDLAAAVEADPLGAARLDPARVLLLTSPDPRAIAACAPLLARDWAPERVAASGRFLWLDCSDGVRASPLWKALDRATGGGATARNLATARKVLAAAQETCGG